MAIIKVNIHPFIHLIIHPRVKNPGNNRVVFDVAYSGWYADSIKKNTSFEPGARVYCLIHNYNGIKPIVEGDSEKRWTCSGTDYPAIIAKAPSVKNDILSEFEELDIDMPWD